MTVILSHIIQKTSTGRRYEYFRDISNIPDYIRLFVMKDNWHLTTADRLRFLRESKSLSYQKLHEGIEKDCNTNISPDSLSNYEVTATSNHTHANKCKGMKIEFLRAISLYYGVSTDWLLGLTDVMSPNISMQGIVDTTGLFEESVKPIIVAKNVANGDDAYVSEFRKTFDIPEYVNDSELFVPALSFIDFVNAIISAIIHNEDLISRISSAFGIWLSMQSFVETPNVSTDEIPFINNDMIAIPKNDFATFCVYEITKALSSCLDAHYTSTE